ncbi:MAG: biotin carboxylase N-terminal domain-containing protein [Desulfovibrionaceae bacterium]
MKKHKILIANRGEIAVRIVQACVKLGIEFVCVYTKEDYASGHISLARSIAGENSVYRVSSYHDANELLCVADESCATAIHPGYGFFAEDYRFARRVTERERKLLFIGPSWNVIRELGDKINTKRIARSLGVPTVPGSDRPIYDEVEAERVAKALFDFQYKQNITDPVVLIKASAGGGGMGIEEIGNIDIFKSVYRRIRNYALRQFKDEGVLIEQRIRGFNHLEVQILSDRSGKNPVHFGTRNCSVQSTGLQKRIEVAPGFDPSTIHYTFDAQKVMDEIIAHSLAMARKIQYDNIGTWEWIITQRGIPYLMEVNTRIQVENGVSARISKIKGHGGVDLLAEQIRLGLGEALGYTQADISFDGFGIEYRIIAEDPKHKFAPWVGKIECFDWEESENVSVYTHIPRKAEYDIPIEFDPNLALAIVWGQDLSQVKERGKEFLERMILEGKNDRGEMLQSNREFLDEQTDALLEFKVSY